MPKRTKICFKWSHFPPFLFLNPSLNGLVTAIKPHILFARQELFYFISLVAGNVWCNHCFGVLLSLVLFEDGNYGNHFKNWLLPYC